MQKEQLKKNSQVQLQVALIPVCKMVLRFGLHFNEFVRNMQRAYIHAAEEILESSGMKPSLQAIAIKTGMDRRTISEHKTNSDKTLHNPLNKMDMLIVQLQLYAARTENNSFSVDILKSIIDSIYARHIRSKAIIIELLSNKIIRQTDDKTFKLNLTLQQQLADIQKMADEVDFTAKRLFQTYYKNMFDKNHNLKLRQLTVVSTRIPPGKHAEVLSMLSKELEQSQQRLQNILNENEANVPVDTFPELGVTQFQFSSLPEAKHKREK